MKTNYIPALRFRILTKLFDRFLKVTMREYAIKSELIAVSNILHNYKILDFGCGTGTLIKMVLERYPDVSIVGVDIDPDILNVAEKKLKNYKIQLDIYDGMVLPYGDDQFDVILSSLVIHHIDSVDKMQSFAELKRVLRPNAKILILDFAVPEDLYSKIITSILKWLEPIQDNIEGKIPGLLVQSGFNNVKNLGYYKTLFGALTIYCGTK